MNNKIFKFFYATVHQQPGSIRGKLMVRRYTCIKGKKSDYN